MRPWGPSRPIAFRMASGRMTPIPSSRSQPVFDRHLSRRTFIQAAAASGGGLMVPPDAYTLVHRNLIVHAAARHRIPAIYSYRQFVKEGGLMSYAPDTADVFRRSAWYVDRILKGAKPAELPVQTPIKFEFVINLKTATTLGLTVPPTVHALTDEVIE